jgi:phosphate transport system substrate-binding protein
MSESEYKQYWIARMFRGEVTTGPKLVSSAAMARRLTAAVPGAIAVIPAAEVDRTVKVLSIDRRLPGVDAYPLTVAWR